MSPDVDYLPMLWAWDAVTAMDYPVARGHKKYPSPVTWIIHQSVSQVLIHGDQGRLSSSLGGVRCVIMGKDNHASCPPPENPCGSQGYPSCSSSNANMSHCDCCEAGQPTEARLQLSTKRPSTQGDPQAAWVLRKADERPPFGTSHISAAHAPEAKCKCLAKTSMT